MKNTFNELVSLGIDKKKSDLIEFFIQNENLNKFEETEHFFYWFSKEETAISDFYKFINLNEKGEYLCNYKGKNYNLNSFDGIAEYIIDVKDKNEINSFFNNNTSFYKREYFLRYSKKYKNLDYFTSYHCIVSYRNRKNYLVNHKKHKFFTINDKNYVKFFLNNNAPRYISNKNAFFLKPIAPYNFYNKATGSSYESYLNKINSKLLSLHQDSSLFNELNLSESYQYLRCIENKIMRGTKNFGELLNKITKNKPVPKVLLNNFDLSNIIYMYAMIDYDEVDKIIKFLYENLEALLSKNEKINIYDIIKSYFYLKFGFYEKKDNKLNFVHNDISSYYNQFISDYIILCELTKTKVNLNIKSVKRLKQEHDNLNLKVSIKNIPEIKVNKKYPKIESTQFYEIELIDNKKRLVLESQVQNHCVKTYGSKINSGNCAIYSFFDKINKKRWTLEIIKKQTISKNQVFILIQFRGKFNELPDELTKQEISKILQENNVFLSVKDAELKYGTLVENVKNNNNRPVINNNEIDLDLPF